MKRYVSNQIGNEYLSWKRQESHLISTPTGSGKTTFVVKKLLKHAIQQGKHMVYICNRRVLNDQFTVQADSKIAEMFEEEDVITAEIANNYLHIFTYQNLENARIFPSVWIDDPALGKKRVLMADEILYYIFDEAHYMVSDAAFNSKTNFWADSIPKCYTPYSILVYLTATPDPLIAFIHSNHIAGIEVQKYLYNHFSERRKQFGEDDAIIQNQVSEILCDFAEHSKEAGLFLTLPSTEAIVRHIKAATDDTLESLYDKLTYALHNPSTGSRYAKKEQLHIHSSKPNYSYIIPVYFKKYEHLIDEIDSTADQKWLIFIDDEDAGKAFKKQMEEAGVEDIGFLSRYEINTSHQAQEIYHSIVTSESFPCRILITTSVLDCGINIKDKLVTNIVIASDSKTSFLQMLGRRRIDDGEQIRLYIKAISYQSINTRYKKYKNEIQTLNLLSLKNYAVGTSFLTNGMLLSICNSFNTMPNHLWYTAVKQIERELTNGGAFMREKDVKVNSTDLILYGIQYSKTGFLYRLFQLQEYEAALRKETTHSKDFNDLRDYIQSCIDAMNRILAAPEYRKKDLFSDKELKDYFHTLFENRDSLIKRYKSENVQKISSQAKAAKHFFLSQQLAWIGKTYDENCWYRSNIKELITFLEDNRNGQLLEPEAFSKECLTLIKKLSVMPPSIKKDVSRYENEKDSPKKNKLEKAFKELNLRYEIKSIQRTRNKKRQTYWLLKRIHNPETLLEPTKTL